MTLGDTSVLLFAILLFTGVTGFTTAKDHSTDANQPGSIFEDKNLENSVRRQVPAKRNNTAPLTAPDVLHISALDGEDLDIRSLQGIEHCKALASLEFPGNAITDITPLQSLAHLQLVDLAGNSLTDIKPLQKLTRLQYLNLNNNQLTDITPLADLPALRSLYLTGNQLTDIAPLAKQTRLWSLYLGSNRLTDTTPLKHIRHLDILDLRGNRLTDITPLTAHTTYRMLFLQDNQLTDLSPLLGTLRKDAAGPRKFSPFLRIWTTGNDLPQAQVQELRKLAKEVKH